MRGIFFEEQDARAAALVLTAEGYAVEVVRERLAGEDDDEGHPWDDEGHPWAVLTDAPQLNLELLVDRYDGWLDFEGRRSPSPTTPVPDLPTSPRGSGDRGGGV
jgi:hypothetical protein